MSQTLNQTVKVLIPAALRPQTDNQATLELQGQSIAEVLVSLTQKYPDLGKRLFKSENELNRFINVYVNDEDIRFMENLDTTVKAGDEVSIVPAIAGG
jgi:MoaD family protein